MGRLGRVMNRRMGGQMQEKVMKREGGGYDVTGCSGGADNGVADNG